MNRTNPIYQFRAGINNLCVVSALFLLTFSLPFIHSADAQCTTSGSVMIPDNDLVAISIGVSGLMDANLSSPTQGICGVEIAFNHEYLGDLTVTLVSPSGTMVQLIGPVSGATSNTNLTSWDVDFVPCGTPANPDGGFTAMWSNEQNWLQLVNYNGTYHPESGCLEDFNVGPANGTWLLLVEDHSEFQLGNILSYTLIFCNPAGLACDECNTYAGSLIPASIDVCEGQNFQSSQIMVDYGLQGPPDPEYLYQYLLLSGNTIVQYGAAFSANPVAGNYMLCGFSYLEDDTLIVNTLLENGDYEVLMDFVTNGSICGAFSLNCVSISVTPPPDTMHIMTQLCQGEVFIFGGENYTTTGTFYQVHDGPSVCDTVFEILIQPRTLNVVIPLPDTLSCGTANQIPLTASASGAAGPFSYQWMTTFGNISSPPNMQNVMVNQAGPYSVNVTDGICQGTGNTTVHATQGFPQVVVSGATLTCAVTSVSLQPIFTPSNAIVAWTGPGGFMSDQPTVNVGVPGVYFISVTNAQGCTTTKRVVVGIDTATASIAIDIASKSCQNMLATLSVISSLPVVSYAWTGPNGFTFNDFNPQVTDAGLYFVTVTFGNGCQRSASFNFDGDFMLPDIMMPMDDSLHCNSTIPLSIVSATPGVSFGWSGPQGFISSMPDIVVDEAGTYIATVIAPNGCGLQRSVTIFPGSDIFSYSITTQTITCLQDTVSIEVTSSVPDLFQWVNYAGPEQGQPIIHVDAPGRYQVIMTDTITGCVLTGTITVNANLTVPAFDLTVDTITCLNPVSTLTFVPIPGNMYLDMYWELPDNTIVQSGTIMSDQVGIHTLFGIGLNGCAGVITTEIPRDTMTPFVFLEGDTLGCKDTVLVTAQAIDPVIFYEWFGPGLITNNAPVAEVNLPGLYTLEATGENGCIATYEVEVGSNYQTPIVAILHDSLACNEMAMMAGVSMTQGLNYIWYNEAMQIISMDSVAMTDQPGQYVLEVFDDNQCSVFDTIQLFALTYPQVFLTSDTLTCDVLNATVMATVDIMPQSIMWTDFTGNVLGMNLSLTVTDGQPVIFTATGPNDCAVSDTIAVPYDTISPVAQIDVIGEVRCQIRDFMLSATNSTPANLSYLWSVGTGQLVSDVTLPIVAALDTGQYYLEVESLDNGCTDTATISIVAHPDEITDLMYTITRPGCSQDANGLIQVDNIAGGVEPFLFQLNGGVPQSGSSFPGLPSGNYQLSVQDAAGCVFDTVVTIIPSPDFTVDAGSDVEIYLGESVDLAGVTDLIPLEISDQFWDSLGIQLCQACPDFTVAPWETTTYTFSVLSETGCLVSDEIIVYVVERGKFFIPNIFSPNEDGVNEEVRIFAAPGITRVRQWVIFDRWGNAVYGKTDFDPGDPGVFWNGRTTTGAFANPAVFPYIIEYELVNGNVELRHGTITLIR